MKLTFVGQSGFIFETSVESFSIDLWLNNSLNPISIDDIPKLDTIFVTHDHADHGLNDAIKLTKRDNSNFISNYDIQKWAQQEHGIKIDHPGNVGGSYKVSGLEVIQTQAVHSSDIGEAIGFIITAEGKTIYHMGDTGYFSTLSDYGEMYDIDLLLVPIGSRYTMGPKEAAYAVKSINPKVVIPMHYNTFDQITQDPNDFAVFVKEMPLDIDIKIMKPGDVITI